MTIRHLVIQKASNRIPLLIESQRRGIGPKLETRQIGPVRILQVLTLSGRNGEYGGPNRVAREISAELIQRGFEPTIFSGALANSLPIPSGLVPEKYVTLKPISKKFPISSLWSRSLPRVLNKEVKKSDLVHIHFARDLVPILTAIICILQKKPFVTQTHGMVIFDGRKSTRVLDLMLTKRIINHSKRNFVLSQQELNEMKPLNLKVPFTILRNGINANESTGNRERNKIPKILFCSRIQSRKRPDRFLELASLAQSESIAANFLIYGPDGGELPKLQSLIVEKALTNTTYLGSLKPNDVSDSLRNADLLILPSENEPFPMVILEALSVGTAVLIMPSCGIAKELLETFPEFVSETEDLDGLTNAFRKLLALNFLEEKRDLIKDYCVANFGINTTVTQLEKIYAEELVG